MHSYHREATVGLLVLLGLTAFVVGTMWLRGSSFGNPPEVRAAYADVGNLKVGSPVQVSGAVVGQVEEINLERVGRVVVTFTYDDDLVTPTVNTQARIVGVGMLGDMVIDFDPGQGAPLEPGTVIEGTMVPGLASVGGDLANKASTALTSLNDMLDTGLVVDLRRTLGSTDELMRYLRDPSRGPTAEIGTTMRQLRDVSARLDTTLANVDAAGLSARLDTTLTNFGDLSGRLATMTSRLDSLLITINSGEGSLGKLVADSSLYVELQKTLGSTRSLLDSLAQHPERLGVTVRIF